MSGNEISLLVFFGLIDLVMFVFAIRFNKKRYEEMQNFSLGSGEQSGAFFLNVLNFFPYWFQKTFYLFVAILILGLIIFAELLIHNYLVIF
ncbi:hypothetical protein [Bacillus sp. EAC]|uniref:hypothetical protein n=1 Tax=Bacillus sp. EAC TaxID=1978338 RepID=UPI000B444245|nr:hypothetical protein [Bacillus sp. EAC]